MAGLKPNSKVVRFFRTIVHLPDQQIAGWLNTCGFKVVTDGPGGFPNQDVFHLDDQRATWIGSRIEGEGYEGRILAFFSENEEDPIFKAVSLFAKELSDGERVGILAKIETENEARAKEEEVKRIADIRKARASQLQPA